LPTPCELDHLDEAITEANLPSFGLAGYAFTRSLATADQLTRRVEVGRSGTGMLKVDPAEGAGQTR
jgi:succinate-semialdehyde dehydrogenase/glutarate-semialdehyde dehydrogenase